MISVTCTCIATLLALAPGAMAADTEVSLRATNGLLAVAPLEIPCDRAFVRSKVNGAGPFTFLLDTGYSIDLLRLQLIEPLGLKRLGRVTIVGIAGEEEAHTYGGAAFDFGGAVYSPRRIASFPADAGRGGSREDGILGAGLFRRFVIELNCPERRLRLYDPRIFAYAGHGETIPLEFPKRTPVIEATLVRPDRSVVRGRFEIDTGCDDGLCLGSDFVQTNRLTGEMRNPDVGMRSGVGGGARIEKGRIAELRLGAVRVRDPSTSLFLKGSPVDPGLAGHIGMAALRQFTVIFDYSRKRMILEEANR